MCTHHNQNNIGISWICRCLFRATFVKRSLEQLSSYFIKTPALSALFGVVRSSPSNKRQRQLELSLSVLLDIRQTLIDEALSSYSITHLPLRALSGNVRALQSKQQQLELSLSGEPQSQLNQQQSQLELLLSELCYVRLMLSKTQRLELSKFALSDTRDHSIISLLPRSFLTLRNCLNFSSTALCGSSRWQHQQQLCPSLHNLDRYALLTATLPTFRNASILVCMNKFVLKTLHY